MSPFVWSRIGVGAGLETGVNLGGTIKSDSTNAVSPFFIAATHSIDNLAAERKKSKNARIYCGVPTTGGHISSSFEIEPQPGSLTAPDTPDNRKVKSKRKPARILVAEDNAINQELIKAILKDVKGVSLSFAENGKEAIDILEAGEMDLVLMDIHMPELAGDEAIKIIRNRETQYQDVPIFVLTADANPHHHEAFMNIGADDCIAKPIDIADLSRIVGSFLKRPAQETTISFAAHKLKQCFDQESHIRRDDRPSYEFAATIIAQSKNGIDCTIIDLNLGGAGLVVDADADIPSLIRLRLGHKSLPVLCRLVWRIENRAGIEFLSFKDGYQRRALRSNVDDLLNGKFAAAG